MSDKPNSTNASDQGCTDFDAHPSVPEPFFTVVLPVYGVERYISNALSDLQAQTFHDWEAVVVDDATPDASCELAQGFALRDPRFRIVRHASNAGLAAARNTGLSHARGRYVTFLDPDDRYDSDLLLRVHESLAEYPTQAVMFGHVEEFYDSDEQLRDTVDCSVILDGSHWVLDGAESIRKWVVTFEKGIHYGYAWNKFYETDYVREHGLTFRDEPLIEDIAFNIEAFQTLESLSLVELPLYRYAKREKANLTNQSLDNYYELHRKRMALLTAQQKDWGLFDDEVRETLGGLMARYVVSAVSRKLAVGDDDGQVREWLASLFDDPLYEELVPYARADSRMLNLAYKPLRDRSVPGTMLVARAANFAKRRAKGGFDKARMKR